jgi:phenylalanyl-tRNA synthetase alpha chain
MELNDIINSLHPIEIKIINKVLPKTEFNIEWLLSNTDLNEGQIRRGIDWLLTKKIIIEKSKHRIKTYKLTEKGFEYLKKSILEKVIIEKLKNADEFLISDLMKIEGYDKRDIGSVIGGMKASGELIQISGGKVKLGELKNIDYYNFLENFIKKFNEKEVIKEDEISEADFKYLNLIDKNSFHKNLIKVKEREFINYILTDFGENIKKSLYEMGLSGDEISQLTPEMLKERNWIGKKFRRYNLKIPAPHIIIGIKHPYREFLDFLKMKFISLGFKQMSGSIVETEFWNMDALYMPQTHPARDIHDVYFVKEPKYAKNIEEPFFTNIAKTHKGDSNILSKGWRYEFDKEKSKRLILRSQGTVLSARMLASKPDIPGKYFAIARCFRYDKVDATHLADFYQVEGIVLGENVNFKNLLGLLTLFAKEIAKADEIKFTPAYFPFTEPSVELHIKHPKIGWYELGGAGIFRPEVTIPLGVKTPVLAWGLGVDRMAMMALKINDIRELFSRDLQFLRNARMEFNYA